VGGSRLAVSCEFAAHAAAMTGGRFRASMTAMNRVACLVRTEAVALESFDHEPGAAHRDPERESAASHGVHFVEAGSFRLRTAGSWRRVGAEALFVTTPGLEFSCAHDDEEPADRCLSVRFSESAAESARALWPSGGDAVRPLGNRQSFLHRQLRRCAPGDAARAEALAGALLESLSVAPARPLFRPERLAWYASRVERAKQLMEERHAEPLSLSTLARDAGMSVFHFARIFGELEGRPPHRFLTEVRLARAHARLREGAGVTDTCFAVGFGSLSHFVTSFRRRYGVRPSALRGGRRSEPGR
jgi:AraC-like DNA-binding protein